MPVIEPGEQQIVICVVLTRYQADALHTTFGQAEEAIEKALKAPDVDDDNAVLLQEELDAVRQLWEQWPSTYTVR